MKSGQQEEGNRISPLHFYAVMYYPVPRDEESFFYKKKVKPTIKKALSTFSWENPAPHLQDFLSFIQKYQWIYRWVPFVEEVYLANSLSFNAGSSASDIDLFVVSSSQRVWTARLFMSVLMACWGVKRTAQRSAMRFCLSFFVSKDVVNLSPLQLWEKDIYLPYWIAHLVPLYQHKEGSWTIYKHNWWITDYLPNFSLKQHIFLGLSPSRGISWARKIFENIFSGFFWLGLEKMIRFFWSFRIRQKQRKSPEQHQWIMATKSVLKFHKDRRGEYSSLFFGR